MNTEKPVGEKVCPPCESAPKNGAPHSCYTLQNAPPPQNRVTATRDDAVCALLFLLLGYVYVKTALFVWQHGLGLTLFTCGYAIAVLWYLRRCHITPAKDSWFWLAILLSIGAAYSIWDNAGLRVVQFMALTTTAVYWTLSASGTLLRGEGSAWTLLDLINGFTILPFGNFSCGARVFFQKAYRTQKGHYCLATLLGVGLGLPVLWAVLALLTRADALFARGLQNMWAVIGRLNVPVLLLEGVLALLVSTYLFGLVYGAARRRRTDTIPVDAIRTGARYLHIMPNSAIYVFLCMLCAVYVAFIAVQARYLVGALIHMRPVGMLSYAAYARRGFFELCLVALINLVSLGAANSIARTPSARNAPLRKFNVALGVLTLLLIITALCKMGLYIAVYGATPLRVFTSVFMLWLAFVFGCLIWRQKKQFALGRLTLKTGAVLFCILCLCNIDGWIMRYNVARYVNGTLAAPDQAALYQCGAAAVAPAAQLAGQSEVKAYFASLAQQYNYAESEQDWRSANLQRAYAQRIVLQMQWQSEDGT